MRIIDNAEACLAPAVPGIGGDNLWPYERTNSWPHIRTLLYIYQSTCQEISMYTA